jgi:hypothetical protein
LLHFEFQQAKERLAQLFHAGPGVRSDSLSPTLTKGVPVINEQEERLASSDSSPRLAEMCNYTVVKPLSRQPVGWRRLQPASAPMELRMSWRRAAPSSPTVEAFREVVQSQREAIRAVRRRDRQKRNSERGACTEILWQHALHPIGLGQDTLDHQGVDVDQADL